MSLKHQYLSAAPKHGVADIPQWGKVAIRSLSLADMERLKDCDDVSAIVQSVLLGVGDENGKRVFSDDDLPAVKELPWDVVKAVAEAVSVHNRLTAESVEDEKKD